MGIRAKFDVDATGLGSVSLNLAARRTGLAFQRTRLAADCTMMAVIRTSLSLISFGFTIYKIIEGMHSSGMGVVKDHAARNFGVTLIVIGMVAAARQSSATATSQTAECHRSTRRETGKSSHSPMGDA